MGTQDLNSLFYNLKTNLNLQNFTDSHFIILIFGSLILISIFFLVINKILKSKKKDQSIKTKPSVDKILASDLIHDNKDKNDFIDILVAIEEEMAAVRELYVSGYITKGIYISETDRLYSKAKIFGLWISF